MKLVCKVNHTDTPTKYRLIASGILSAAQSDETAFLRLRFFYMNAAMFLHYPNTVNSAELSYPPNKLYALLRSAEFVVTDKSVSELLSASPKRVAQIIKNLKLSPLFIPQDSLFYGLRGNFYTSYDMAKVAEQLESDIMYGGKNPLSPEHRNIKRCLIGINLIHPKGVTGIDKAKALYTSECKKLLHPPTPAKQLTYDTLDYSKIDWAAAATHKNFEYMSILKECPDRNYLLKYSTTPFSLRTETLLKELAEEAGRHHRGSKISPVTIAAPKQEDVSSSTSESAQPQTQEKQHTTLHQLITAIADQDPSKYINAGAVYLDFSKKILFDSPVSKAKHMLKEFQVFQQHVGASSSIYVKMHDLGGILGVSDDSFENFRYSHTTTNSKEASPTCILTALLPVGTNGRQAEVLTTHINVIKLLELYIKVSDKH